MDQVLLSEGDRRALPVPRGWVRGVAVGATVLAGALLSRQLGLGGFPVPAFSAIAGVYAAFAVGRRGGRRVRWFATVVVSAGALRVALGFDVRSSVVVALALGVEAVVFAAAVAGHDAEALRFGNRRMVPRLVGAAALAAAAGGVVVVAGSLALPPPNPVDLAALGLIRAGADLTGIMAVAPLVAVVPGLARLGRRPLTDLVVAAVLVGVALHVGFVAGVLVYPYFGVAALLFAVGLIGWRAAAVLPALWATATVWYSAQGLGPWAADSGAPLRMVLAVQCFNVVAIVAAWLVAALSNERERAFHGLAVANEALESRVAERTAELRATVDELHREVAHRHQAESRYRALFTESASVMLVIDPVTDAIVDANQSAVDYYGWSYDELVAMRIGDINTLSRDELRAEMTDAHRARRNRFEFRHRRADGEVRDVEVYSGPITVDGTTLLYSIVNDVTEAKRAARALRESEERFRSAFDNAPVGMVEIDLDPERLGRYLHVNQAFCDMVGRTRDELLASAIPAITHPDDRPGDARVLEQLAAGTVTVASHEKRYRRPDGGDVSVTMIITVLTDRRGHRYALEHIEDVTERKKAKELSDRIFDVNVDPICILSVGTGRFVRVNPAWRHTVGWSEDDLVRATLRDFVHPDDRAATVRVAGALARGELILGFEHRFRCTDGTYRWLQWNSAPLADGRLAIGTARDITDQKASEAELVQRALYDTLTGLANRHLLHERLRQALDHLDRHPGTFALCYVDLDGFKDVNDTLGHEAGDRVLVVVARRLVASVRAVDTVARLAGDEFVLICPDLDDGDIAVVAQRIIAALNEPVDVGTRLELGASIGVVTARDRSVDAAELLRRADAAMYEAKRQGRNRWQRYLDIVHGGARYPAPDPARSPGGGRGASTP